MTGGYGSGIAVALHPIVYDDLVSGRLVVASDISVATGEAYYLVGRDARDADARAIAFRAWVMAEAMECTTKLKPDHVGDTRRRLHPVGS